MKPKRPTKRIYKQMIDIAYEAFERTGRLPALRIRENAATGEQTISSLPDDCEDDGMHRTIRRLPRR